MSLGFVTRDPNPGSDAGVADFLVEVQYYGQKRFGRSG